jgi:hypothetical protein
MTLESLVRSIERTLFDGRFLTRHGVKMFGRCVRVSQNTIEVATPNQAKPGFNASMLIIGFFRVECIDYRVRNI